MLNLYNALTRNREEFKPIHAGKVGMYVCGPTVYDHCHLGHARGYVAMDILRRYLEYSGYEVRHIMNYTDVGHLVHDAEIGEDKIEQQKKKKKIAPMALAEKYIASCKNDFEALNIKKANFNPRPTQYIAQIIKFTGGLIKKGFAYEVNGSVYFSVEKLPGYGKLSGRKTEDLEAGARVEINPEKKNPLDFALWIKAPKEHILKWESPWGVGYPGWHIECSVMSCELLGNFTTIKDALKKYDPMVIRLWILSSHYRSVTNFTEDALIQAKVNFQRISDFVNNLKKYRGSTSIDSLEVGPLDKNGNRGPTSTLEKFEEAMDDDLNTPLALSALYDLITETNKLIQTNKLGADDAQEILKIWEKINKVFGLVIKEEKKEIPQNIKKLAEERKLARENKDFKKSDELRAEIEKAGYVIEDLKDNKYAIKKK